MLRRALLVAALLVPVSVLAVSAPAQAAPGLTATFSAANNGSCFLDKFIVANPTTAPITGWTLEFDLPPGVTMGSLFNGTATQNGSHVTVANAHYNGTVAAGANTEPYSPWFIANGSGAVPLNCRINGNKCDGSADRPPNAPLGLSVTGRTTKTVSLSWNAATASDFPIVGYDVLVAGAVKTSVAGTTAVVTGLGPNTTYAFTVRAKDTRAGTANGEWQSANGAAPGQFQEEAGTRGYADLLATVSNCPVVHDLQSTSTYCFTGNGGQWWSFDDTWSIQQKTGWLKTRGLLGAMVWEMSGDTSSGTLMTAIHSGLS